MSEIQAIIDGKKDKLIVATAALCGCFGCHMSLLDIDELLEQAHREVLLGEAAAPHVGKRIETPARQVALEANFVEAPYNEIAAPVILLAHLADVVPAMLQGLERPFLHAARLAFTHPASGERLSFEAPLPPDLLAVLERLRESARD